MKYVVYAASILAVILSAIAFYISGQKHLTPSLVQWDKREYEATPSQLCPGETFTYETQFTVNAPADRRTVIERHSAWVARNQNKLAITREGQSVIQSWQGTPFDGPTNFPTPFKVVVPNFPPGEYGLKVSADVRDQLDDTAGYTVWITIPATCAPAPPAPKPAP